MAVTRIVGAPSRMRRTMQLPADIRAAAWPPSKAVAWIVAAVATLSVSSSTLQRVEARFSRGPPFLRRKARSKNGKLVGDR